MTQRQPPSSAPATSCAPPSRVPLKPERDAAITALIAAFGQTAPGTIAFLTDGIDTEDASDALTGFRASIPQPSASSRPGTLPP
jgi:hypothetical protein